MAKNTACPAGLVAGLAQKLTMTGLQALLDNLERLTTSPKLLEALLECPSATTEQREQLEEMQQGAAPQEEIDEAVAAAEPDALRRRSLVQKLAHMNVVQRITLALKGGREERMALIRDRNKVVQRAVLQAPRLTEQEVESFAAMTVLTGDVLRTIALHRIFVKNYTIVKNLVSNPKTPLDVSLHLLPRLTPQDLRVLTTNRNIPDNLRTMVIKLYRQRKILGH